MKVSAMATSTGDWLSRAMVVGGALTAVDILLPPSRTDQSSNHKSKSCPCFMASSSASPRLKTEARRRQQLTGGDTPPTPSATPTQQADQSGSAAAAAEPADAAAEAAAAADERTAVS